MPAASTMLEVGATSDSSALRFVEQPLAAV
jgi:hypothetical protein